MLLWCCSHRPYETNALASQAETTKAPVTTSASTKPATTARVITTAVLGTTTSTAVVWVTGEWTFAATVKEADIAVVVADILDKDDKEVVVQITTNEDGSTTATISVKKGAEDADIVKNLGAAEFSQGLEAGLQLEAGAVANTKPPQETTNDPQATSAKSNTTVVIVVVVVVAIVILVALIAIVVMRRNGERSTFTTTGSLAKMQFSNPVYESNVEAAGRGTAGQASSAAGADPFYASLRRKDSVRLDNAGESQAEFEA